MKHAGTFSHGWMLFQETKERERESGLNQKGDRELDPKLFILVRPQSNYYLPARPLPRSTFHKGSISEISKVPLTHIPLLLSPAPSQLLMTNLCSHCFHLLSSFLSTFQSLPSPPTSQIPTKPTLLMAQ